MKDSVRKLEEQHQNSIDLKDQYIIGLKANMDQLSKENKKLSEKLRDKLEEGNEYNKIMKDCVRELEEQHQNSIDLKDLCIMSLKDTRDQLTKEKEKLSEKLREKVEEGNLYYKLMEYYVRELEEQHQNSIDLKEQCIIGLKEYTDQLSKENKRLSEKLCDKEEEGNLYDKIMKDTVRELEEYQFDLEGKDQCIMILKEMIVKIIKENDMLSEELHDKEKEIDQSRTEHEKSTVNLKLLQEKHQSEIQLKQEIIQGFKEAADSLTTKNERLVEKLRDSEEIGSVLKDECDELKVKMRKMAEEHYSASEEKDKCNIMCK
jgi:hypothetical protein